MSLLQSTDTRGVFTVSVDRQLVTTILTENIIMLNEGNEMKQKRFDITIKYYENLEASAVAINAWRYQPEFPIDKASLQIKEVLREIRLVEIVSESFIFSHDNADVNYFNIISIMTNILISGQRSWKTIHTEYSVSLKSRIRTYKGFFSKILKDSFQNIEIEIDKSGNYSYFVGTVLLEPSRIDTLANKKELIGNCFYLYSSLEWENCRNLLLSIEKDFVEHNTKLTHSTLNYLSLITSFCKDDTIIMRISGDGDEYLTLQLFTHQSNVEKVKSIVDYSCQVLLNSSPPSDSN